MDSIEFLSFSQNMSFLLLSRVIPARYVLLCTAKVTRCVPYRVDLSTLEIFPVSIQNINLWRKSLSCIGYWIYQQFTTQIHLNLRFSLEKSPLIINWFVGSSTRSYSTYPWCGSRTISVGPNSEETTVRLLFPSRSDTIIVWKKLVQYSWNVSHSTANPRQCTP